MVQVRRRTARTRAAAEPVSRRRDRARADEEPEDDEDEEEAPRSRPRGARAATRPGVRRVTRSSYPEEDEEGVEDEDEEDEDEDEEEPAPRARRRSTTTTARRSTRRAAAEEDDDEEDETEDEEDDEEAPRARSRTRTTARRRAAPEEDEDDEDAEPAPRRRRTTRAAPAARTRRPAAEDDDEDEEPPARRRGTRGRSRQTVVLPAGVKTGMAGADEISKSSGGANIRLPLSNEPELIKVLQTAPFASYKQHWANSGQQGQANRPYTCMGPPDCPLCAAGDQPSSTFAINVLWLSAPNFPENRVLQIGIKAWNALKDVATDKTTDKVRLTNGFFAVVRSGKGTNAQTNFRPVKERDIEDDWDEILENFDMDELDDLIAEAKESAFLPTIVQKSTRRQLLDVAKYMSTDDD